MFFLIYLFRFFDIKTSINHYGYKYQPNKEKKAEICQADRERRIQLCLPDDLDKSIPRAYKSSCQKAK